MKSWLKVCCWHRQSHVRDPSALDTGKAWQRLPQVQFECWVCREPEIAPLQTPPTKTNYSSSSCCINKLTEFLGCLVDALHHHEHTLPDPSFSLCVSVVSSFLDQPSQVLGPRMWHLWRVWHLWRTGHLWRMWRPRVICIIYFFFIMNYWKDFFYLTISPAIRLS